MLWEIIFFTGFLYCSGHKNISLCSSDCTTEKVLGYDGEKEIEFQGKYTYFNCSRSQQSHLYFTAAYEGHLVQLEFLPDKEVGLPSKNEEFFYQ